MNEFREIEKILNIVKSRIDAHIKFKKEYDKQLAFDFSLFQFFSIGENKISQVLAYFLDEKQNHAQGNIFLNEFVKTFYDKEVDVSKSINICEKIITGKRRIDIYIKLKNLTIAIENKVWANDQPNQLKDYVTFLENNTKGDFLLFYLTPYGHEPTTLSISEELKNRLKEHKKFQVISYKHDIINLINNWLVICEADNVSHFLKEFKKYLEIKFLGKNTLNMSKELRALIYTNEREVQQLVNEYKGLENEILSKLNTVGKKLDEISPNLDFGLELSKSGLFNWDGTRVYKYSVSKGVNKIWVQLVKREIHLYSNYYLQEGTDLFFNEILTELNINKNTILNHNQNSSDLIRIFLSQVKIANDSFKIYEERMKLNE